MEPTGGVMVPMQRFMLTMMPNCTGCIPKVWQMGRKMGVKMSTAGVGSMKVPTTSRITFMSTRMTYLFRVSERMPPAIRSGRPVKAMTQDMMEDRPIMRAMMPVILAESRMMRGRSFRVMPLYRKASTVA